MLTSENLQRYVRVSVYYLAGMLTSYGFTVSASNRETIAGFAMAAANLAWTMYGNRINAKLAEISKAAQDPTSPVKGVVMTDTPEGREVAAAIPGPVVTEGSSAATEIAKAG